ncbi:MAG: hypothetical protein AB7S49_05985 [Arcobacter sp.]|uniref:Uncharacterized protein n=2 Tax=Arcobacter TaxID=28196 RepID=A0AAE7E6Y5_9BACT|nr:hypothetical protein [Arcobacter defluvii]QKF76778.1 hypothetical protein ADFLV_0729 [Arcobacter defluvii]RXI34919.1 hypothetical protein CP964_02130 [Arcobacter defluvii]
MKKAYTLLITITLVTLFTYLASVILETKSLRSQNLANQYLYLQAKNHMNFFKDYMNTLDLKEINHLQIEDDLFDIYANIEFKENFYISNLYVKAKDYDISLHEKVVKE